MSSRSQPLIRRHSRSLASAFLRTAAEAAYATFFHKGRRKEVCDCYAFLAFAFFAFAAFFTGFSFAGFFSTFAAIGVLAAIRIDRA